MSAERFDVIVIGGGPAGSTVAALLAQSGRSVALFEKEQFPRFHIGESLLPCATPLFERLGILPEIERRFLRKHAAEIVTFDGRFSQRYGFAEGLIPGSSVAFEVDRAEFDQLLLDHAVRAGADVHQKTTITQFEIGPAGVAVTARDANGTERSVEAAVLVDASGRGSLVAGRQGLRAMDPVLRNFSVFSHFEGAKRYEGDREGDISIVLAPEGWWWVIPLRGDRTSVGLVAPSRVLAGRKPDESYFFEQIAASPFLEGRLGTARRIAPVRTLSDWSYTNARVTGDRWLLVGDAAGFIDPVFSTGVYFGVAGAFRAACAIEQAFARGRFDRAPFADYERWLKRGMHFYRDFVQGFYDPAFVELLLRPSDRWGLRGAVTSLLAGFGLDRDDVPRRVRVFQALARLNRRFALAPRLPERRQSFTSSVAGSHVGGR